jgi:hypothetical protein
MKELTQEEEKDLIAGFIMLCDKRGIVLDSDDDIYSLLHKLSYSDVLYTFFIDKNDKKVNPLIIARKQLTKHAD